MSQDKLKLLKSVRLLGQIPESQLASLAGVLKPLSLADGQLVFEEGSVGRSLFFVAEGAVRISKRVAKEQVKDLAILAPGDCFGEMALVSPTPRSARATAQGATQLLELEAGQLQEWLKSHPEHAIGFFTQLVELQSGRLRRTSSELALLFDLSSLLLEPAATSKDLLRAAFERVLPHMHGAWSAAAFLYNRYNEEYEPAASVGAFDDAAKIAVGDGAPGWRDAATFFAPLPGEKHPVGYLLFRSQGPLGDEDRTETGRTLTTAARLMRSAVENIEHRTEEKLRARLKGAESYGSGI